MKPKTLCIAFLAIMLVTPVLAQNGSRAPAAAKPAETDSCLLNHRNGRWVPSGMPDIRRVFGDSSMDTIGYAGRIDGMAVYIADYRCDHIAYEVTLVGPGARDEIVYLAVLRKIEQAMGFSNARRLTPAGLDAINRTGKFAWKDGDVSGSITFDYIMEHGRRVTALYDDQSN